MPADAQTARDDVAFLRSLIDSGEGILRGFGLTYLAAGLVYGVEMLLHGAQVAGLLFFMQLVFMYFQIMPAFPDTTIAEHWMDFVMPLGLGGMSLACFLWQLKSAPLLPAHDLNREATAHLRSLDQEQAAREEALLHE